MTTASEEGVATEVTEQVAALKLGAGADDPAPAHDPPVAEVNDENFVRLFVGDLRKILPKLGQRVACLFEEARVVQIIHK